MYQEDQVSPEEEQVPAEESMDEAPVEEAAADGVPVAPEASLPGDQTPPNEETPDEGGSRTWLWIALAAIGVLIVILGYFLLRPSEEPTQKSGFVAFHAKQSFLCNPQGWCPGSADQAGIELIVVDSQDDPAREATNIEDLIQQGVDAILVNPTDADAVVPSIQKANQANIPVFTIDRGQTGVSSSPTSPRITWLAARWQGNSCAKPWAVKVRRSNWKVSLEPRLPRSRQWF